VLIKLPHFVQQYAGLQSGSSLCQLLCLHWPSLVNRYKIRYKGKASPEDQVHLNNISRFNSTSWKTLQFSTRKSNTSMLFIMRITLGINICCLHNVIFLHPVARSITQSFSSSVFVRRLIVYLTLKHLMFTTCFSL
jgi:hypothetical protein